MAGRRSPRGQARRGQGAARARGLRTPLGTPAAEGPAPGQGAATGGAAAPRPAATVPAPRPAETPGRAGRPPAETPVPSPEDTAPLRTAQAPPPAAVPDGPAPGAATPVVPPVADASLPLDEPTAPPARAGWHLVERNDPLALAAVVTGVAVMITGACYLGWRASHLGGTGVTGPVAFVGETALYLTLAGLAALAARVNRGFARRAPSPAGSLDVFVVCRGEPVGDVDRALRAARALTYPHRTFLLTDSRVDDAGAAAGRGGSAALDALASRQGIPCLRRADGPPNRAALLNQALACTSADAVLVVDAGDVLTPDAGDQLLGYLRDNQVGLVAGGWRASGGAGPLPERPAPGIARIVAVARDRDGACAGLGSGTLYRRIALESIGGFSTRGGLEESRTSYDLHAAGWASVQHPGAVLTRALRPPADAARITVTRAADRMRVLVFDNPVARRGLTGRQRVHHLAEAALPLAAVCQVGLWAAPALAVLGAGRVAAGASPAGWFGFGLPYLAATALFGVALLAAGGTDGDGPRAAATSVAGWLAAGPLALAALGRLLVLGGHPGAAPDAVPARAAPPPLPALGEKSRPRGVRGLLDRRERARVLAAAGWTPLLAPVALGGLALSAAIVAAIVSPGRAAPLAVVWAGAVLLAAAEPIAAAFGLALPTPASRRRVRAAITAATALAVLLGAVAG